jgi:hypothetical protein
MSTNLVRRKVKPAVCFGFLVTLVLFVLIFLPPASPVAEAFLKPGTWLPQWYWGGFHDVFPILLALVLSGIFYSIVLPVVFVTWSLVRDGNS